MVANTQLTTQAAGILISSVNVSKLSYCPKSHGVVSVIVLHAVLFHGNALNGFARACPC
jgi:hypothetical protein